MDHQLLENFLASAPYAETSKRTYRAVIPKILDQVQDPRNLTASDLIKLLSQSGWGNSRQCLALAAVKKFLAWAYPNEQHPAINARLKRVLGKPQRALDPETALQLLASFDRHNHKGARDLAMCSLALDTGLRAAELCRLQQADTDLERRVLQVIVKGGQWEAAVFSDQTAAHIDHWLHYRKIADGQGFLFTHIYTGEGLTPEGLFKVVEGWGQRIGIKLSVHDLRRSFAVLSTMNGAAERVLMEGGRWKSSQMITRYTRTLKLEAMRKYLPVSRLIGDDV